jgi:hypothetical protein
MRAAPFERDVQAPAREIAAAGASERTRVFHLSWLDRGRRIAELIVARDAGRTDNIHGG